jgi:sugar/nucleoside kinase (ribokinase family)
LVNNGVITVYAPDGTQVTPNVATANPGTPMVQDTNGNFYTYAAGQDATIQNVVDTLGRTPVVVTRSGNQVFIDYLCEQSCNSANGDRARVTVNTASVTWTTQFNQNAGNWSANIPALQAM